MIKESVDQFKREEYEEIAKEIASQLNASDYQILGSGWNGYAFKIGDLVAKITTDDNEFTTAGKVQNINHRNLYKIRNRKIWRHEGRNLYILIYDYVNSLTSDEKEMYGNLDPFIGMIVRGNIPKAENGITSNMKMLGADDKEIEIWKNAVFSVADAVETLADNGIIFTDYHKDNVGKDKSGNLVLFDVRNVNLDG